MKRNRRRCGSEKGSAIIEFALSFSLLFLVFSGVYEYGYFCWVYNALESSVRDGAALAGRLDYDAYAAGGGYRTAVQNMVVFGSPDGGASAVAPGLTTANVNVLVNADAAGVPASVTVGITNYQVNAVFKTRTINKPVVTTRYYGGYKVNP